MTINFDRVIKTEKIKIKINAQNIYKNIKSYNEFKIIR